MYNKTYYYQIRLHELWTHFEANPPNIYTSSINQRFRNNSVKKFNKLYCKAFKSRTRQQPHDYQRMKTAEPKKNKKHNENFFDII